MILLMCAPFWMHSYYFTIRLNVIGVNVRLNKLEYRAVIKYLCSKPSKTTTVKRALPKGNAVFLGLESGDHYLVKILLITIMYYLLFKQLKTISSKQRTQIVCSMLQLEIEDKRPV